jgi:hypothetical protein
VLNNNKNRRWHDHFLGFPRNMADTGEYLEQVGRLDGVILLNWTEDKLIKQVRIMCHNPFKVGEGGQAGQSYTTQLDRGQAHQAGQNHVT